MLVENLSLMQDGFRRSTKSIEKMVEFVSDGGAYDPTTLSSRKSGRTAPIVLTRFEDQRLFVHDGLHRVASIFLGRESGRLFESEFEIQEFTYQEYDEINLQEKYFTPFDPRKEVRVADLANFKTRVSQLIEANKSPIEFIENNRSLYACLRQPFHDSIRSMVKHFRPELCT